jgi:hypothetical protein
MVSAAKSVFVGFWDENDRRGLGGRLGLLLGYHLEFLSVRGLIRALR